MPETPYDLVLHAARELPRVETALTAELLGAALLGSVYAIAEGRRAAAVREFVGGFLAHTSRRRSAPARAIRSVFAGLVPEAADAAKVRPGADPPRWSAQIGRVRSVGTWAYGDVYGDQTSYLATFAYDDPDAGGAEHAVVALVDHNIGIVKDLFVGQPASRVLAEVRRAAEADELVWLAEVDPGTLRAQVSFYLEVTDGLAVLPEEGSLATDRALAASRLALLPAGAAGPAPPEPADPARLLRSFLASRHAAGLDHADPEAEASLQYAVRLIVEFSQDSPDADPLRWSPAVVGLFLLDWVHRRAVLDDSDVATLPRVLRAWAAWAAEQRELPAAAAAATGEAIELLTPELVRLHSTGERRGEAATAMDRLLADGVDPDDENALRAWLDSHQPPDGGPPTSDNGDGPNHIPRPR
jgi:hypothetical protein